jgi:hypothetical protein
MPGLSSYFHHIGVALRTNFLIPAFLFSVFLCIVPAHSSQIFAAAKKYTIKARADSGGEISPSGDVRVEKGNSQTFTITPDQGFTINDVIVDKRSVGAVSTYTFENVQSNHEIRATFSSSTITITAEADKGGEILPSGKITVEIGSDQTFNIIPNEDRMISDVWVDDESVGVVSSYAFYNVTEDHKIKATFTKAFTITPFWGEHGTIEPSAPTRVAEHSDLLCTITPDPGYLVEDVKVDMKSVGPVSTYLFKDIKEDHVIEASFKLNLSIQEVSIPDFPMKVGDVVTATLTAANDEEKSYSLVSGSVGGYTLTGLQRISPTSFTATFAVAEGGESYLAYESIPVSDLIISDGQVESPVYSFNISQENDPIDAQLPVATKLEVQSMEVGPGGTVDIYLMADGNGYAAGTGTIINGIPVDSDRVTFSERSFGAYVLSYVVSEEDNEVPPGELEMTVVLVDPAGNIGNPYSALEPNSLEIYTALPKAMLAGPTEICEGEDAVLSIRLEGRSPWDLILNDGTRTYQYTGISSPEYTIEVAPPVTTTYQVASVTDINGIENGGSGEVTIKVNEVTDVEIMNLAPAYSLDAQPVTLEANVPGGTFSGPGVFTATGTFYPDLAGMSASPHTITYTYESINGCMSADNAEVYVLGTDGAFLMQDTIVCSNGDPVAVTVMNLSGEPGAFTLLDSGDQPTPGLEDHGDNTATIDPSLLDPGSYRIEFRYKQIDNITLNKSFLLEPVTEPVILAPAMDAICQNGTPLQLLSNLEGVVFEGPGIHWTSQDGFYFYPEQAGEGKIDITCTYLSENGCRATSMKELELLPAPEAEFGMSSACIPEGGEIVTFNNYTTGTEYVAQWQWDFGDPASGSENQSNLMDPTHFYEEPGRKEITLAAVTYDGCTDTYALDSVIDNKPQADFTWLSDCLPHETGIQLINKSRSTSGSLDTIVWRLSGENGNLLYETGAAAVKDTVAIPISSIGKYSIELYTANSGGCDDKLVKEIELRSTIRLDKAGYQESFNSSEGGWSVHGEEDMQSWVWGIPDFTGYEQEAGDHAWFTQLPSGYEEYREHSWVMSPCFDLSQLERPLVRLDIMRSFVPVLNGAVLQYRDILEEGWKTVGAETPGINWYNTTDIIQQPGGSSTGWGMEEFDPDHEWVAVAHDLEQVKGSRPVTFRVALATNGRETMGNQGFALNNFQIGERSKLAVLEHFTDNSDDRSRMADSIINAMGKELRRDVIDLQYHMSYYAVDPMFENNPEPTSARVFHYGVPSIPYAVLEGGSEPGQRYDFADMRKRSLKDQILLLTLEEPAFDLDLNIDWQGTGLEAQTTVTCNLDRYTEAVQLYLVVIETSVTAYSGSNGNAQFRNVVLDMLPAPTGTRLGDLWVKGMSETRTDRWEYPIYVEDENELAVVAFIEDRNTNQILQAEVQYRDPAVDVPSLRHTGSPFTLYPNPAENLVYASLGDGRQAGSSIEIIDLGGKLIFEMKVPSGTKLQPLNLGSLNRGIYLVRWVESGTLIGVKKLVIFR